MSLEAYRNRLKEQCEYNSLTFKFIMELDNPPKSEAEIQKTDTQQTKVTIKPKNLGVHHSSACRCRYCE